MLFHCWVFCGFLAENLREHMVEEEACNSFLQPPLYEELKKRTRRVSTNNAEV
jgi:guanylate kinase